jgi:hypothetical protein
MTEDDKPGEELPLVAGTVVERTCTLDLALPLERRRVALLRVPSWIERERVKSRIDAIAGPVVPDAALLEARDQAIDVLPGASEADRAMFRGWLSDAAAIRDRRDALAADANAGERAQAEMPGDLMARISRLERYMRLAGGMYVELMERRALRANVTPAVSLQMLLVGARNLVDGEGRPIAVAAGIDGVPETTMLRLQPFDLMWIGLEAHGVLWPSPAAEKNSASPSGGTGGAATSTGTASARTAGPSGSPPTAARGPSSSARPRRRRSTAGRP